MARFIDLDMLDVSSYDGVVDLDDSFDAGVDWLCKKLNQMPEEDVVSFETYKKLKRDYNQAIRLIKKHRIRTKKDI